MLLNAEELLALLNGDVEPDRLADLLDRLEHCPESDAALQALVTLRANREQSLEALRQADAESTSRQPIFHPSARRFANPSAGWGMQALRLAASIALVAVVGIWGATTLLYSDSVTDLATKDYQDFFTPEAPHVAEPTADAEPSIDGAAQVLAAGHYTDADKLLEDLPIDTEGRVRMYRGMSAYFLEEYEEALTEFSQLDDAAESGVRHQAAWYEANALLALDRPFEAMIVLGKLRNEIGYRFQAEASAAYQAVCDTMGISCTASRD